MFITTGRNVKVNLLKKCGMQQAKFLNNLNSTFTFIIQLRSHCSTLSFETVFVLYFFINKSNISFFFITPYEQSFMLKNNIKLRQKSLMGPPDPNLIICSHKKFFNYVNNSEKILYPNIKHVWLYSIGSECDCGALQLR